MIVVPEQKIGPAVLKKAKDAGIPMIAVDDTIKDETGKDAPFVGFSSVAIGKQVGCRAPARYHGPRARWHRPSRPPPRSYRPNPSR